MYTQHRKEQGGGHTEGNGVIIQGETCHARKFQTMNKFTSNQLLSLTDGGDILHGTDSIVCALLVKMNFQGV